LGEAFVRLHHAFGHAFGQAFVWLQKLEMLVRRFAVRGLVVVAVVVAVVVVARTSVVHVTARDDPDPGYVYAPSLRSLPKSPAEGFCYSNAECGANQVCVQFQGLCGRDGKPGRCWNRRTTCPAGLPPACGCDGKVYGDACEAHAHGVDVSVTGGCERPKDRSLLRAAPALPPAIPSASAHRAAPAHP
jgi:hypothetical protein